MKLIFVKILIGTSTLNLSSLSNFQVTKELLKMERNEIVEQMNQVFCFIKCIICDVISDIGKCVNSIKHMRASCKKNFDYLRCY